MADTAARTNAGRPARTPGPGPTPARRLRLALAVVALVCLVLPAVPADATALPSGLRPSLVAAPTDYEALWHDGCFTGQHESYPKTGCIFGNRTGKFRVALVGDSHASAWFPAVERVARARGWRLEVFVKASCVPIDMRQFNRYLGREYVECKTFLDATIKRLRAHPPDLLIITAARIAIVPMRSADRALSAKIAAFARMIRKLPAKQKVILGDTPYPGRDIPACLAAHRSNYQACSVSGWEKGYDYGIMEKGAAKLTSATRIDIVRAGWCRLKAPCPVVVDGMVTFRDRHHLTATFSRSLGPVLNAELRRLLPNLPDGTATPTAPPTPTASPAPTPTPDPTATPGEPTSTPPEPTATPGADGPP